MVRGHIIGAEQRAADSGDPGRLLDAPSELGWSRLPLSVRQRPSGHRRAALERLVSTF